MSSLTLSGLAGPTTSFPPKTHRLTAEVSNQRSIDMRYYVKLSAEIQAVLELETDDDKAAAL
jgi:hypothetical protein